MRPKLVNVAYTARYLCDAAKVVCDRRRLPDFEACVRTHTCTGGSGGTPVKSKWMVMSKRRSVFSHTKNSVRAQNR